MKRYCNLFFLLFSLLFISNRATCASSDYSVNSDHFGIAAYTFNSSYSLSTQEPNSQNEFTLLLFRKGIEGKSPLLLYTANLNSLIIGGCFTDFAISKAGLIKHLLSFSDFLILPPEFLSAISSHAPPILC